MNKVVTEYLNVLQFCSHINGGEMKNFSQMNITLAPILLSRKDNQQSELNKRIRISTICRKISVNQLSTFSAGLKGINIRKEINKRG